MIKKIIIIGLTCTLFGNVQAQTGINTENPTSALDVNGSTRIINNLLVGGNETTNGSAGTAGQYLISKGAGLPPEWQTVTTPIPETGDWYLLGSLSRTDTKGGARFTLDQKTGATSYATNYSVEKPRKVTNNDWYTSSNFPERLWSEFEDFIIDLPAFEDELRLIINIQMLAQAAWDPYNTDYQSWISYSIAVFEDMGKTNPQKAELRAVRQGGCFGDGFEGSNQPQQLVTLVVTLDIPANKATKLRIMGTQRNNNLSGAGATITNAYLTLGHLLDGGNDSVQRRATMRADIYKKVRRD